MWYGCYGDTVQSSVDDDHVTLSIDDNDIEIEDEPFFHHDRLLSYSSLVTTRYFQTPLSRDSVKTKHQMLKRFNISVSS